MEKKVQRKLGAKERSISKSKCCITSPKAPGGDLASRVEFEQRLKEAGWNRLREVTALAFGTDRPEYNLAFQQLLTSVLINDLATVSKMEELQRRPVSDTAFLARLLALDGAISFHWNSVQLALSRAAIYVEAAMEWNQQAGVKVAGDTEAKTLKLLIKRLSQDDDFCFKLASQASSFDPLELFDRCIEQHLSEIVWGGLRKNGKPIHAHERTDVYLDLEERQRVAEAKANERLATPEELELLRSVQSNVEAKIAATANDYLEGTASILIEATADAVFQRFLNLGEEVQAKANPVDPIVTEISPTTSTRTPIGFGNHVSPSQKKGRG